METQTSGSTDERMRRWPRTSVAGWALAAFAVLAAVVVVVALRSSGASPSSIAADWISAYEAGEVATYEALMADDAWFTCVDCSYGELDESGVYLDVVSVRDAAESRMFSVSDGSLNAECTADGNLVTCDTSLSSVFGFVGPNGEPEDPYVAILEFTVEDEQITAYTHRRISGNRFDYSRIDDYRAWVSERYADEASGLFYLTTMLLNDTSQIDRHRELVAEWAAASG